MPSERKTVNDLIKKQFNNRSKRDPNAKKAGQIERLNTLLAEGASLSGRSIRDIMKELNIPRSSSKATTKQLTGFISNAKNFVRGIR